MSDGAAPVLEVSDVSKSFGSTRALRRVSLDVRPGEVHVLAGENGAGKSTLIEIVAGVHPASEYEGTLRVGGAVAVFRRPRDAVAAGISTIHQELSLVGSMSVADNLALGAPGGLFAPFSRAAARADAARVLASMGLDLDPDRPVESLPLGARQLVEIARALSRDARVLVMDEPTSALGEPEAERLFSWIGRLREQGRAVVFISHRLEEIYRVADRITVLRDGMRVTTAPAEELPEDRLVQAMVGRSVEGLGARAAAPLGAEVLRVTDLVLADPATGRPAVDGASFSVRQGETLGLAGLRGSGASELLHGLSGRHGAPAAGTIRLDGEPFVPASPARSIRRGVVLLASDRSASVLADLGVVHNTTLSSLRRFSPGGWIRRAAEAEAVGAVADRVGLSAPSMDAPARQLSGGNQQKVALARCLLAWPRVLLLDEPTRGIDVGARADVHRLVRELADRGMAVVLVASELDELIALSDRIAVLYRGRIAARLAREGFSRERIVHAALGGDVEAA